MPDGKLTIQEFATKIKTKYPQYNDIDDNELTQKILAKYPQYNEQVISNGVEPPSQTEEPTEAEAFIKTIVPQIPPPIVLEPPKQPEKTPEQKAFDFAETGTTGKPPFSKEWQADIPLKEEEKVSFKPLDHYINTEIERKQADHTAVIASITPEQIEKANILLKEQKRAPLPPPKMAEIRPITEREEEIKKLTPEIEPSHFWGTVRAVNEGTASFFRDLDGAASFISDMTGVEKSGTFGDIADYIEKSAQQLPETPNTLIGNLLQDAGHLEGMFLELALTPEFKSARLAQLTKGAVKTLPIGMAEKITLGDTFVIPKIVTQLGASGFAGTYATLNNTDASTLEKTVESFKGMGYGIKEGILLSFLGYGAGKASEAVKKATESGFAAWGVGLGVNAGGFGGLTAVESIITSGNINWDETRRAAVLGGALSLPGLPNALLNRAFGNFFTASPQTIKSAKGVNKTPEELRTQSTDLREQAQTKQTSQEKEKDLVQADVIDNLADIKVIAEDIINSPEKYIEAIKTNEQISETEQKTIIKKINKFISDSDPSIEKSKPLIEELRRLRAKKDIIDQNEYIPDEIKSQKKETIDADIEDIEKKIEAIKPEKKEEVAEAEEAPQPITATTFELEQKRPEMLEKFEYYTEGEGAETKYFKKEKEVIPGEKKPTLESYADKFKKGEEIIHRNKKYKIESESKQFKGAYNLVDESGKIITNIEGEEIIKAEKPTVKPEVAPKVIPPKSILTQKTDLKGDKKQDHQMPLDEFLKKYQKQWKDAPPNVLAERLTPQYTDGIKNAVNKKWYQEDISKGRMTANDAKTIIESAGLEVSKDILEMAEKEKIPIKAEPTEKITPEELKKGLQVSYDELKRGGINKSQAENVMAYMGSIDAMKKMSPERLKKELIKIPTISEKSADKVINYIKNLKKEEKLFAKSATARIQHYQKLEELSKASKKISKEESQQISEEFEERQKELEKFIPEEELKGEKINDETNRIFNKIEDEEIPTQKEIDYINENAFLPKGYEFGKEGLQKIKEAEAVPKEPITLKTKGVATKIGEFEAKREGKEEPFKLFERTIDIMKKYAPKSKILQGYTGKTAIGLFNTRTKNLRIQGLNQINVVFHELSHALDDAHKLISGLPKSEKNKLAEVYLQYYPGAKETHPASKKAIEGYAMLLQKYLESPSMIKAQYPDLVTNFIEGEYAFPDIKDFLKDADQLIADYQKLAPLEKMGARIVGRLPEIKTSAQRIALKTQTEIFDHLQALEDIDKKTKTLFTENDVTSQIRAYDYSHNVIQNNLTGEKYLALNDKGEYEFRHNFTWETISENLVKKHGEEGLNGFGWWLYSRRVKSWYDGLNEFVATGKNLETSLENKLKTEADPADIEKAEVQIKANKELQQEQIEIINNEGVTEREANEAHNEGKDKYKDEAEMFDKLVYEDVLLLANPKINKITAEQKKKFDENVGKYAPFRRAFTNENIGNTEDVNMNMNPLKPGLGSLKRLSGSQKPTINPLLSAMANHAAFTKKAAEQRVYNMVYENLLKYPEILGKYYEQIPLTAIMGKHGVVGFKEISDPTVIIAKDKEGKSVGIKILDTYIAKVLHDNFAPNDFHIALKIFIESTRIFKAGTTGYFPPFLVANTTLDAVSRFVNTRTNLIPFFSEPIELTKALALPKSAERGFAKEYFYLAGKLHTRMGWNQVAFKEGTLTGISAQRRWKVLANGMGMITDFLGAPSNFSEIAPRMTEYIRARKEGKTQAVSLELAGRVTVPFHHRGRMGGKFGQAWVKAVPYMNPTLQVLDITGERLKTKEGAARFAIVSGVLGAISGATLYTVFNKWDDEAKEKAINLLRSKSPKELSMYVYTPDPFEEGELIKIRVPQEHSYIALGINMYILEKYADAQYTPKEIAQAVTAPIPDQLQPWKGFMWVMSLTPQLPKTAIETGTNTATFPEPKPIETIQDKRLVPEMRYSPYTTDFAKWLARTETGKKMGLSPKMIDHFIKGNLGRASGYITGKPKMFNLGDIFRAKMYMNSTRQTREFWEKAEKYEQEIKFAKDKIKEITGGKKMTNSQVLTDYGNIKEPRIEKTQMADFIKYMETAEIIFDKFSELNKLDPEIEEKGFEKLSNEIMQNLVDINKGKYIAPKKGKSAQFIYQGSTYQP